MSKKSCKIIIFKHEKELPSSAVSFESMEYNKTGSWRNFRPVINHEKCTKCMTCWKFCPEGAIRIREEGDEVTELEIDYEYCKGCGICWEECPIDAIDIEEEKD